MRFNVANARSETDSEGCARGRLRPRPRRLWRRGPEARLRLVAAPELRRRQGLRERELRKLPHAAGGGRKGTAGPNLDQVKPSAERVVREVQNGGTGMPSFRGKLSAQQISDVARFVSGATGTATGIPAEFTPDDTKLEDCGAEPSENRCYEQAFANLAYEEGPEGRARRVPAAPDAEPDRGRELPPDRAHDRRRRPPPLQGKRRQGVRRRQQHLRLRLLPRAPPVEARGGQGKPGRRRSRARCATTPRSRRSRSTTTSATTGSVTA